MTNQLEVSDRRKLIRVIILTGLLVGTLDISSAFVDVYVSTGRNPLGVLTYIASGVFGEAARGGGAGMMLIGLLFHYCFAFGFTVFFFWIYRKTGIMARNRVLTGVVYGIIIWLLMNLVVVQLSRVSHVPISAIKWYKALKAVLILICMIGLPLSFMAHNFFYGKLRSRQALN